MKHILCILLLCLSVLYSTAQLPSFQTSFTHLGVENILPSSECYFSYKDSKNYLWFCTDKGLVKFDGYNHKLYNQENGLLNNVVFKVYEDFKKRIWIISLSKKLCYIEDGEVKEFKHNKKLDEYFKNIEDPNKNILIDNKENLYITYKGRGTLKINPEGKITYLSTKNQHQVQFFRFNNEVLISTNVNLQKLGVTASTFSFYNSETLVDSSTINWNPTFPVLTTNDVHHNRYIVINNSIFKEHNLNSPYLKTGDLTIFSIKSFTKDKLFIGTNKGLLIYDCINHKLLKDLYFLKEYTITSINKISNNSFILTTLENGVFIFKSLFIINNSNNQIKKNDISSLGGIKSKLIIGYNNFGWISYDKSNHVEHVNIKISPKIFSTKGFCILSCKDIDIYKNNKKTTLIKDSWYRNFCIDNERNVYLCARDIIRINNNFSIDTLYYFLDKNKKESRFEAIVVNNKNEIIASNLNGLFEIKNNNSYQNKFTDPIFKERVSSLAKYKSGVCIAATRGKGIYFFDNFTVLKKITKTNGLLTNDINILYIDSKNRLWIGSNKGVNVIMNPNSNNIYQITKKNGLVSNEVTSFYEYKDTLWVGTKKGLSKIDINNYEFTNENKTQIFITSVIVNGKKRKSLTQKNILKNNENSLEVNFRTNNFNNSLHPTFSYRINKGKWETINKPKINFNNLAPGEYKIEIKHLNENNNWSKPKLLLNFKIDLPYYLKWYSITFYIIIIGLIFFIIYKIQIKQIKQKEITNKKIKALETKSLSAQMNPHFIFNALNSIQSFIIFGESDKAEHFLTKFAQLIRQTLNNSRTSFITIQNEIDTLKKYIEIEEMRFKNKFTHEFIFENIQPEDFNRFIPPLLLQPFVENAILHAFKKINYEGIIKIRIKKVNNYKLLCCIEDNGIGIQKSLENKTKNHISLGSNITQERLNLYNNHHNNSYNISFNVPESLTGTLVLVEIPIFENNEEF